MNNLNNNNKLKIVNYCYNKQNNNNNFNNSNNCRIINCNNSNKFNNLNNKMNNSNNKKNKMSLISNNNKFSKKMSNLKQIYCQLKPQSLIFKFNNKHLIK